MRMIKTAHARLTRWGGRESRPTCHAAAERSQIRRSRTASQRVSQYYVDPAVIVTGHLCRRNPRRVAERGRKESIDVGIGRRPCAGAKCLAGNLIRLSVG